jgi:hypothetical protein
MADLRDSVPPSADVAPARWRLRVLNGPARGATCDVKDRVSIGRAGSCDLQLVEQEVSRQHARIVEDEHGNLVLEDLRSSNGTFVDGEAIARHVLRPHTVFTIVQTELVFEPASAAEAVVAVSPERITDIRTMRNTAEHNCLVARSHAPTTPTGAAVPSWAITDRDGRALIFERPDGGEYEGNLVDDVIEYRMLRAQHLRGGFSDPTQARRFAMLRARLLQPAVVSARADQRAFRRFGCWLPAELRLASGEDHPCQVRDIGVDGAQIVAVSHGLELEAIVWLAIEVLEDGQPRSLVLAARVAWIDEEYVGVAFAGAPRRVEGRYAQRPGPVARENVEERAVAMRTPLRAAMRLVSLPAMPSASGED